MENILRIELNMVGIFLSLIVIVLFFKQIKIKNQEDKLFLNMLILTLIELILDGVFWEIDGRSILLGRQINLVINYLYYFFQILQSCIWFLYCSVHMGYQFTKRINLGLLLAFSLGTALIVLNIGSGYVFTVDQANVYRRTWGTWGTIETLCCLFYPAISTILTIIKMVQKNNTRKNDGKYLLFVSVLPIACTAAQLAIYGLNIIWPGLSMALLLLFIEVQSKQYRNMENELTENKIQMMLSQIQPHFLYNSLSAIQVLCIRDPEKAEKALEDFSIFLRANMDSLGSQAPVVFEQELSHVEHYLNLEKIRFGEDLHIVFDISETEFVLPVLTLQPIVENAVKHGICKNAHGGTVTIQTFREDNSIVIMVSDDGTGFDTEVLQTMNEHRGDRSHIGIINVKNRFESENNRIMTINSKVGYGTTVKMKIFDQKE